MRKCRCLVFICLCFVMCCALSACGGQEASQPEAGRIDTFIIGTTAEISSAKRSVYNFDVLTGTLSQLAPVWVDADGVYHPLLCTYSTEDSRTWILTVREGMTWHDGQPVSAADIQFTLEYLDSQNGGGYADSYEDIRLVDERTIALELAEPNPRHLASLTTLRILPKHIYQDVTDDSALPSDEANIGCGPYRFVRFDADAGVLAFDAYDAYPDGQPMVEHVLFRLFDNEDTMYMALKSGEIDMVYRYSSGVSTAVLEDLQRTEQISLLPIRNTANSAVLIFNNQVSPFDNEKIRQALACAIDYARFRELFGSPYALASEAGFIPPGTYGYVQTQTLERDLQLAAAYLQEAGCTDSDDDGYLEYQGQPLCVEVMVRDDKPVHARYAELLMNNLAEVGIAVQIDVQEVAAFRELTEQQHAHAAVITGLTAFGMAKNQGLAALYLWGENSMSYGQVYDEDYKALLDQADAAANMEEYALVAAEIQQYYADTLPAIALFWDSHIQAFNSRYSGFVEDGTFGLLNVQTWFSLQAE